MLEISRRNNERAGVTGLLLFNGKRFLQLLEGSERGVDEAYTRISRDPRHFAVVKLSERAIEEREFGAWSMGFERFAGDVGKVRLVDQVKQLTRAASPNVKALFTSYASI